MTGVGSGTTRRGRSVAATALLVVLGSGIIAMWTANLAGGWLAQGFRTVENNQLSVFHLSAELLMGATALAAGLALWRKLAWAPTAYLVAVGMMVYSTVNSLGHSVRNAPELTPILLGSLVLAAVAGWLVHNRE
jgi:hypothetical protein